MSINTSTESPILLESSIILITDNANGLSNYYTYSPILLESCIIPNSDDYSSTASSTDISNDCDNSHPNYNDSMELNRENDSSTQETTSDE